MSVSSTRVCQSIIGVTCALTDRNGEEKRLKSRFVNQHNGKKYVETEINDVKRMNARETGKYRLPPWIDHINPHLFLAPVPLRQIKRGHFVK